MMKDNLGTTNILALMPDWLWMRNQINSQPHGVDDKVLWARWGELCNEILAQPCVGPADFAAKVVVINDLSMNEILLDDRVNIEAVALVKAHLQFE